MSKEREDRRIRRTRRLLKQGLAELMREKDFKDISIKDITDRMDLNRGTFYLHFADTYELLERLENDTLADVQEMIDAHKPQADGGTLQPVFEPIMDYVLENEEICKSLFGNQAAGEFIDKVHRLIEDNGKELVGKHFPQAPEKYLDYLFSFITYGLIGMIRQWFQAETDLDKHAMVMLADRMVTSATESLLARNQ
ncbi:MAG: TetR/AcrR family transcriptional regulator [Peptococcaceae bacterium]|nr:TetR/AcrR family transcriptional regulator [Peptococcaceae bacterium]